MGLIVDIEGNEYSTVIIGTQEWTVQNLRTTKYRNGENIPKVIDNKEWEELTTGAYSEYLDANDTVAYGFLYNGFAAFDEAGLAPEGWHIPTDTEWTTLTDYLGGENVAGGKLKEAGIIHWESPNMSATNESGFTAFGGGVREWSNNTGIRGVRILGHWWSSSEYFTYDSPFAYARCMLYGSAGVEKNNYSKIRGFSIRCIKN